VPTHVPSEKKLNVTVPVKVKPAGAPVTVAESPTDVPRGAEVPDIPVSAVTTDEVPVLTVKDSHELS
jgi:hypothetical protein